MRFAALARVLARVEEEPSSRAKAHLLGSCLLSSSSAPHVSLPAVLLAAGVPLPGAQPCKGVRSGALHQALAALGDVPLEEVDRAVLQSGDAGLVAEWLVDGSSRSSSSKSQAWSCEEVVDGLQSLCAIQGKECQKRQAEFLRQALLARCQSGVEARFLVRSVQGSLRVGAASNTVVLALCVVLCPKEGKQEDKERRQLYQTLMRDYGSGSMDWEGMVRHVEDALSSKESSTTTTTTTSSSSSSPPQRTGSSGNREGSISSSVWRVGTPLSPMLAVPAVSVSDAWRRMGLQLGSGESAADEEVICEYKYDGVRALVHVDREHQEREGVLLQSRSLRPLTDRFGDVVEALRRDLEQHGQGIRSFVMDSELVALDPLSGRPLSFQALSKRVQRKPGSSDPSNPDMHIALFVFDLLELNGEDLRLLTLRERRARLEWVLATLLPTAAPSSSPSSLSSSSSSPMIPQSLPLLHRVPSLQLVPDQGAQPQDHQQCVLRFLRQSVSDGCEGLIVKRLGPGSQYVAKKRSTAWIKLKRDYLSLPPEQKCRCWQQTGGGGNADSGSSLLLSDSLDLVPLGAFWGQGRRAGVFGAFVMGALAQRGAVGGGSDERPVLVPVCRVGTGFSDEALRELTTTLQRCCSSFSSSCCDRDAPPTIPVDEEALRQMGVDVRLRPTEVWELRAAEVTVTMTGVDERVGLRFPRFVRTRPDKEVEQATRWEELREAAPAGGKEMK